MRTKLSLALGPRGPISRQTAWGCFTTNLAMPGFGSLIAGRAIGYAQIPFTAIGFVISLVCTIHTIMWFVPNWTRLKELQTDDPAGFLVEFWAHIRWPLFGMAIFAFALVWALMTSLGIMAQARKDTLSRPLPPKLKR